MSDNLFEYPILPTILGVVAGGMFYFWAVKSRSKLVGKFRNLCVPRPYFQESVLDGSLSYSIVLVVALILSSSIATDMIKTASKIEGFFDTLLVPFLFPVLALYTMRWDINKPKRAIKSRDPKYHGESLNWACYGFEAFMTISCCLLFVLVFDTAHYLFSL